MRKIFLWVAGHGVYATFMIGYLLVLTLLLPSTFTSKPNWIEAGSYAEYTVEQYTPGYPNPVESGTYAWRIISTYTDDNGDLIARINETYILGWKEDWWKSSWAKNIPSAGRILDINANDGLKDLIPLWLNRYYNDYLIDISDFKIGNVIFEGECLEKITAEDENRLSARLTTRLPTYYRVDNHWFDRETGLLLKYTYDFRGRGSRMSLKSTNIVNDSHNGKATIDLFFVAPLFIVPVVGAATGLLIIKRKGYKFSRQFWFFLILFNGIVLAFVANFPFRTPLGRIHLLYVRPIIQLIVLNALFWIGVLVTTIFLIDRLAFPIILKQSNDAQKKGEKVKIELADLSLAVIFASLYLIVRIALAPISFEAVHLHVADCLTPLAALFGWPVIAGVTVGYFLGSTYSWFGSYAVILESIANLIAATLIFLLRKRQLLACAVGSLPMGIIVGGYLWLRARTPGVVVKGVIFGLIMPNWLATIISITISNLVAMAVIGYTLLKALSRPKVINLLKSHGLKVYVED